MDKKIIKKVKKILSKEPRLIEIKKAKKIIFVGDTHGNLAVSQKVIKNYLKPENKIVFMGDYVDRRLATSKDNIDFLLKIKSENPDTIYLLQGNHEGYHILKFAPAEFWENLSDTEYKNYYSVVEKFPLAVISNNIIALHGSLPDIKNLKELNKIKLGSKEWQQIVWGDFFDELKKSSGTNPFSGRPYFGKDYFLKLMKRFKKDVLIRSHQIYAPEMMFDDRCLTIFSCCVYIDKQKKIVIADMGKKIKTAKDLEIIDV